MTNPDYLVHYGIPGMRWGRRKNRAKSSGNTSRKIKKSAYSRSEDSREVKELRKKPVAALSNAELKKINQRMNLEREYRNLRKEEIDTGKKSFEQVLNYIDTANRVVSTTTRTINNVNTIREGVDKTKPVVKSKMKSTKILRKLVK